MFVSQAETSESFCEELWFYQVLKNKQAVPGEEGWEVA